MTVVAVSYAIVLADFIEQLLERLSGLLLEEVRKVSARQVDLFGHLRERQCLLEMLSQECQHGARPLVHQAIHTADRLGLAEFALVFPGHHRQ